jgi:hypothetical protein
MGDGRQTMKFFIHYRPADGEIFGWGNSFDPQPVEGNAIALVDPVVPDPMTQKYHAELGRIIEKTAAEQRAARHPIRREVEVAIYLDLTRTDPLMIADYPIDDAARHRWQNYRQMLRDLSRLPSASEMIEAWQLPPDGIDPIAHLRERLKP